MKYAKVLAASLLWGSVWIGGWAQAGIEGSKHDFTNESWSGGDACGVCHTPHLGEPPTAAPLWDQNADLTRTFGTALAQSSRAGLGTVICLRCHDGTIARDTLPATRRERIISKEHPGLFQGGHDTSNHPVGVVYPQFDKGFRPAPSVIATGTVALPGGKVECISCHDPHNLAGEKHLLVRSNAHSSLCLTCHRK